MTQIEQIRAEIERRKAEAELARLEAEGVSSLAYNIHLAEENLCMFLLFFLDTLEQEQPSLPSDLDEAAEEYGRKEYSHAIHFWDEGLSKNNPEVMKEDFVDSFKAGAQWMAEQRVTKEAVIGMATKDIEINVSGRVLDKLELGPGDKVIVQIRKK